MKNAESKTHKTGKEQSPGTTGETGNQTEKSEKAGCGEIIRGIEKIGDLIGRSYSTAMGYIKYYGLPAVKGPGSVWELDLEKFKSWAAALGWTRQMSETELGVQARKKNLMEAGPGKIIEGTFQHLAKRLYTDTGTLSSYMKQIDCPIQKNDDNTYRVDLHAWELFQIKYRVGEYRLTGNQKGRISWT